jgi:hypothetical protein
MRAFVNIAKILTVVFCLAGLGWLMWCHKRNPKVKETVAAIEQKKSEDSGDTKVVRKWMNENLADPMAEMMELREEKIVNGTKTREVKVRGRNGKGGWVINEFRVEFGPNGVARAEQIDIPKQ